MVFLRRKKLRSDEEHLVFRYAGKRGVNGIVRIMPIKVWYGTTSVDSAAQWYLKGHDLDEGTILDYQMKKIRDIY